MNILTLLGILSIGYGLLWTCLFWLLAAICSSIQDTIKDYFTKSIFLKVSEKYTKLRLWLVPDDSLDSNIIFLKDAWHFFKLLKLIFMYLSIVIWLPFSILYSIIFGIVLAILWGLVFGLFYERLLRLKKYRNKSWWKFWK